MTETLIDSHCHPHFPQLETAGGIDAVRAQMESAGIKAALAVATGAAEWQTVTALAQNHRGIFYAACGVHPLNDKDEADNETDIFAACESSDVSAVGETGLDFFRGQDSEVMQRRRFAAHIAAARRLQKPLIIHTRDSQKAVLDMLRAENARDVGGVLHCFTGNIEDMRVAAEINFVVSFSGIVTFPKSAAMREVAAAAPADGYMVETDAPYLSPAPHRGKINTPAYVRYVAEAVAAARGQSFAQTAKETTATFRRLFKV